MFWLDRDRDKKPTDEWPTGGRRRASNPPGPRTPSPHVVISGRQLREEILGYGPAFLQPEGFPEPEAFRALVTILAAYALGSRTAARLVRERQAADPSWQPPSRREAMQVVSSLNRLRQYLPYLIGQRAGPAPSPELLARAGPGETSADHPLPPGPAPRPRADDRPPRMQTGRPVVQVAPAPASQPRPVVNTRPPPPEAAPVLIRPVINVNKR